MFDVKVSSEGREAFRRPLRGHVIPPQPAHLATGNRCRPQLTSFARLLGALCAPVYLLCAATTQCRLSLVPLVGRCRAETWWLCVSTGNLRLTTPQRCSQVLPETPNTESQIHLSYTYNRRDKDIRRKVNMNIGSRPHRKTLNDGG